MFVRAPSGRVGLNQRGKAGGRALEMTLWKLPRWPGLGNSSGMERMGWLWRYLGGRIHLTGFRWRGEEQGWQSGVWLGCWVNRDATC